MDEGGKSVDLSSCHCTGGCGHRDPLLPEHAFSAEQRGLSDHGAGGGELCRIKQQDRRKRLQAHRSQAGYPLYKRGPGRGGKQKVSYIERHTDDGVQ